MGLQVWLPLNGDLHNQGLSNIELTGTPASWDNNGKIGKCGVFSGSTANVLKYNTEQFNYIDNFSWTIWIKTNYTGSNAQFIFTNGRADAGEWGYGLQCTSTTQCAARFGNKSYPISVTGGEWTHLIFTKLGTNIKIYKNGILYCNEIFNGTLPTYGDGKGLGLGCFHYSGGDIYPYYGSINDFRIYDHCLSPKEAEEIAKGLILHYPLNNNGMGNENLINNSMFSNLSTSGNVIKDTTKLFNGMSTCKISKTGATSNTYLGWTSQNLVSQLTPGEKITVSVWVYRESNHGIDTGCEWRMYQQYNDNGTGKTDWTGFYDSSSWTIGQWVRFSHTYTIRENITGVYFNLNVIKNGTYWIAQPKVERGSLVTNWCPSSSELNLPTAIIYDTSGYNNNGTIVGTLTTISNTLRYNCSTLFNGTNNAIVIPYNDINPTNIFTVNLWFYKNALGSKGYETLFGGPSGFEMDVRAGTATTLSLYMASTRGGNVYSPFNFNEWYMVTMVRNGTNELYYINGTLVKTIEAKSMPVGNYYIGAWATSTQQNYYGNISDFRIYATALTDAQIKELYNTSMTIDNQGNIYARELVE